MKNKKINLIAYRCACWKEKLYCLAKDFNLLFSVDLQNGKTEPVDIIPEGNPFTAYLCGDINVWNDKLILTPSAARKIWIYDLLSKHWDSIDIKECEHWGIGSFTQTYIYGDTVFGIGSSYPAIICINLKDNSCSYIEAPYKDFAARHADINYNYFRSHGAQVQNTLYLASCLDNFVLKFDMETQKYQWIKVGDENHVYSAIAWDGKNFWLSPRLNGGIVKWDGKENIQILPLPRELKETVPVYSWEACYDGHQVILPHTTYPKSILVDIQNDNIQFCDRQYPLFMRSYDGITISQTIDGDLSVITDKSSPETYHVAIDCDQLNTFYKQKNKSVFDSQTLHHEVPNHPLLSLEGFLAFAGSEAGDRSTPDNGSIGKKIWEQIRP